MQYSFEKLAEEVKVSSFGAITEEMFEEIVGDLSEDPEVHFQTSGDDKSLHVVKGHIKLDLPLDKTFW